MEKLRWKARRGDTNFATVLWRFLHNLPTQGQVSDLKLHRLILKTQSRRLVIYWLFGVYLNVIRGRIFTFGVFADSRELSLEAAKGRLLWKTTLAWFQVL
jgi:hypothetical protein